MKQAEPSLEHSVKLLWERVLEEVSREVPRQTLLTWFKPLVPVDRSGSHLIISAPSQFFVEWIESHYRAALNNAVLRAAGPGLQVNLQVGDDQTISKPPALASPQSFKQTNHKISSTESNRFAADEPNLVPHLTFDNFVEGDSNRFARAAAFACAERPGKTPFNPLLIFGGAGLGKTHLLQAIGNHIINNSPNRVIYVTSEQFTSDFIKAIESRRRDAFAKLYRSADVLLLDDVQFLMAKEKTQEEFFHTFNAFHHSGKQLVFSSDRPPKDLTGFDERLVSRLQWGLVTEITRPDYETRVAIINSRARQEGIELPPEVAHFLAQNITDNVRTLQGALIHLLAQASLMGQNITIDLAKSVLKKFANISDTTINPEKIIEIVCRELKVAPVELKSRSRRQEVAEARHIAMFLCTEYSKLTLKAIGLYFGGRDHATVIHAREVTSQRAKQDKAFSEIIDRLRRLIELSAL